MSEINRRIIALNSEAFVDPGVQDKVTLIMAMREQRRARPSKRSIDRTQDQDWIIKL